MKNLKTLIGLKPLIIKFNKIDVYITIYNGTTCLVLLSPEKYDAIYSRISYLISQKGGIKYTFSSHYAKIKVDSYDSLPIEKC